MEVIAELGVKRSTWWSTSRCPGGQWRGWGASGPPSRSSAGTSRSPGRGTPRLCTCCPSSATPYHPRGCMYGTAGVGGRVRAVLGDTVPPSRVHVRDCWGGAPFGTAWGPCACGGARACTVPVHALARGAPGVACFVAPSSVEVLALGLGPCVVSPAQVKKNTQTSSKT